MATVDPTFYRNVGRFLYTGLEVPRYYPGCWISHGYFDFDKLGSVEAILQRDPSNTEVINMIIQAYKEKMYTRYETIAYALVKCILKGNESVKNTGYKAVSEVCVTSEELMLFTKFSRFFKTGQGHGWRKAVSNWYLMKEPLELAKECSRVKARHGRSHQTLMRKSHIKVDESDIARNAVISYVVFGMKQCKQSFGSQPEAQPVMEYLEKLESLRHCEDPAAAACIISHSKFTLEHVPAHLLTNNEVWDAIIPQFSLSEILENLQRIHNMGFLSPNSKTADLILSMFNDEDFVKKSNVTALEVHITIANYEKNTRPLKYEKLKATKEKEARRRTRQIFDKVTGQWQWTVARRHPKEVKHWGIDQPANPAIVQALYKLMDQVWGLTPSTNKRYMITLDMRSHMFKGRQCCKNPDRAPAKKLKKNNLATPSVAASPAATVSAGDAPAAGGAVKSKKHLLAECFFHNAVTPGHVGIITALQLCKREKDVNVAVFTDAGVEIVAFDKSRNNFPTLDQAEKILTSANVGKVNLDAPIEWAKTNNKQVDVFINVVDRVSRFMELDASGRAGRGQGGRYGPPPSADSKFRDRCPVRALEAYRRERNLPNTKLITMSLASHKVESTDGSHEGVLDIIGADVEMQRVMDAFARNLFQ